MKIERPHAILLSVLGLLTVCVMTSAWHGLMMWDASLWRLCARLMPVSHTLAPGLAAGARAFLVVFSLVGLFRFGHVGWKTQRFVATLRLAALDAPPVRLAPILERFGLSHCVIVFRTERPLAFCFGLLRPRIALSTGLANSLTPHELTAVLLHEDYHRRHWHPLWNLLADSGVALLAFLPVTADFRDWAFTLTELHADRYAACYAGRPALAGALHKLLTLPQSTPMAGLAGLNPTTARLAQLLDGAPLPLRFSARRWLVSSALLVLGCLLAFG